MEICPICQKELKNANGLRLHMRSHKGMEIPKKEIKEEPKEEPKEEVNESEDLAMARVKLYKDGALFISYVVHGLDGIEQAKLHAEKKGMEIEISDIVTVNI